jgi:2-iminobutanoate/2-iminopropanoate deaminase
MHPKDSDSDERNNTMTRQEAFTAPNAPRPVGPYSPALVWQNLVFISGQGPLDPGTNKPIEGDITEQTRQVFANLEALLAAAGSSRKNVLKCTVYLANIQDFASMNAVYKAYFEGQTYPARTTIQAAALPGGIGVEIDMIAFKD